MRTQQTIDFPKYGKVRIVTRSATSMGNLRGFYVNFNDRKYYVNGAAVMGECIKQGHNDFEQAARDIAFVRWVGEIS